MNDVIKWGLIGVAAYWVYSEYFAAPAATIAVPPNQLAVTNPITSTPVTSTPATNTVQVSVPTVIPVSSNPIRAQLIAEANTLLPTAANVASSGDTIAYTIDEWNYAYNAVTGKTVEGAANNNLLVGALVAQGIPGNSLITVDQYLNALSSTGLGGLRRRGMRGLGAVSSGYNGSRPPLPFPAPRVSINYVPTGMGGLNLADFWKVNN